MTKSTGVGTGNGHRYDAVVKSVGIKINYSPDKIHSCRPLTRENAARSVNKESQIHIFKDFDSGEWNMKVGLEFVRMNTCPFCRGEL